MSIQLAPGFAITPTHSNPTAPAPAVEPSPDFGPLALLLGTWTGHGFNNIWRPHHDPDPRNDHFLELNLTNETLEFSRIPGSIPNRGLRQVDITMFGVNYLQQISDQNTGEGLHFEPGMWVNIPATTDPLEPPTVARLASIPHGTVMLAQGTVEMPTPKPGPPQFTPVDITPFPVGHPDVPAPFKESTLSIDSPFRSHADAIKGITQAMVDNPSSVLLAAIASQTIIETVTLKISSLPTSPTSIAGGGTANTAFLQGAAPGGGNADAAQVDATFWIETVQGQDGQSNFRQLQYCQRVLLNFNTLSWPHVSVATLRLSPPANP